MDNKIMFNSYVYAFYNQIIQNILYARVRWKQIGIF